MNVLQGGADVELILRGLNEKQREAVLCTVGPLLVVAGPGSGKTRVLTTRIAYLIATGQARPHQILALTFTNKAAREMQQRVLKMLPEGVGRGVMMGTFHSIMARLLRIELREGWLKGYTHEFSIYDTDDSERVIRQLMEDMRIDKKEIAPRSVRHTISGAKNRMVTPSQLEQRQKTPRGRKVASLYGPYQKALNASNALDFDDLLLKPIELFREHPHLLEKYQNRWRFVHIDEYQDTNRVQYLLSHAIAANHRNICVVGDDAQSIYAFRGADMRNILDFNNDYSDAAVVRLEQNYRSTPQIIKLADSIIRKNKHQLKKTLWTENAQGDQVMLIEALTERDEAQRAVDRIREHHGRHGYAYSDFAILYRTNAQSRNFEDALRSKGIPYRVVGGMSFYQRKEIKDALSYLRLLVNQDDQASLFRIINYPSRGIGLKTQEKLRSYVRSTGVSPWEALNDCRELKVGARAVGSLTRFRDLINQHRERLATEAPDVVARNLLKEARIFRDLDKDGSDAGVARVQNVQELISAIAQHVEDESDATLSTFLQSISLLTDADSEEGDQNRVTLMTLHASKGLEFKVVFIGGMEDGLFPSSRALDDPNGLEEERRLFYVGITRAEKHLYLAYAISRFQFGRNIDASPSQFLMEMDGSFVQREGTSPYERASRTTSSSSGATWRSRTPYTSLQSRSRASFQKKLNQADIDAIEPGVHVMHGKFGKGYVVSVSGRGLQKTAVVRFDERGPARMMLRYARLQLLE